MRLRPCVLVAASAALALVLVPAARGQGGLLQQAYVKKATNPLPYVDFGLGVAVDHDTLLVGTSNEHVSVLTRSGATWRHRQVLRGSNTEWDDFFGHAVALDGETLVVGAAGESSDAAGVGGDPTSNALYRAGAAYVFVRAGGAWTEQAYLKASNPGERDGFGASVAISGDRILIGAPYEDSAGTGVNGDQGDGVQDSGAAYVFVRDGESWRQEAYLKAPDTEQDDLFASDVAISGDTATVAAPWNQSVYVYRLAGAGWRREAQLRPQTTLHVGFGIQVDVDGNTIAVGQGYGPGSVQLFRRDAGAWNWEAEVMAGNGDWYDAFSWSLALQADRLVVGAFREDGAGVGAGSGDDDGAQDSGAAYVFQRTGGSWNEAGYLKASNTDPGDHFGGSVALSGETVVVSASAEESGAIGVDGDQTDNSLAQAGAVYAFAERGPLGAPYCTGAVNSTGRGAWISASGSPQISDNDLTLHAADLPPRRVGVFLYGDTHDQTALGDGIRCVANPRVLWAPLRSDASGRAGRPLDFGVAPLVLDVAGSVPGTWFFQFWYRDGSSSNLTDGLEVGLLP